MSAVFLKLLNMSVTASWLILAILLVRFFLKKAPKWISCILWALAAIRLSLPFSLKSTLSLIPNTETIQSNIEMITRPALDSEITAIDEAANSVISNSVSPAPLTSTNTLLIIFSALSVVWVVGMAVMLLYALISYITLKRSVRASVSVRDNILACDEVKSPFILGFVKPLIYIPSSMESETLRHVITHETSHIKRHDHWWKPFGFLLLSVYWFNPLCWIAYILFCRDIEMACDEKVIGKMDKSDRISYSQALLNCSFPRRKIAARPLAFGEISVKERVKSVLNYRRPAIWIIVVAVIACIVVGVCFLTNPYSSNTIDDKMKVTLDMAITEHSRSNYSDGNYSAYAYDVFGVKKHGNETTVYAYVFYERYIISGDEIKTVESSSCPTVFTVDTSENGDSSVYELTEYWTPKDGSNYTDDIKNKYPMRLWSKVFDYNTDALREKCLSDANAHFNSEVIFHTFTQNADGSFTADNGLTYKYQLELVGRFPNATCDSCYVVLSNSKDITFERVCESFYTSDSTRFLDPDDTIVLIATTKISNDDTKN